MSDDALRSDPTLYVEMQAMNAALETELREVRSRVEELEAALRTLDKQVHICRSNEYDSEECPGCQVVRPALNPQPTESEES